MGKRWWLLLVVALVVLVCLVEITEAKGRSRTRKSRARNPTKRRTPSPPPRMPPTVRRPPRRTRKSRPTSGSSQPGQPARPGSTSQPGGASRPGGKTTSPSPSKSGKPTGKQQNKRNKPTQPGNQDFSKAYGAYRFELARRFYKLSQASYCKPATGGTMGTFLRQWVRTSAFPRARRKSGQQPVQLKTLYSIVSNDDFQGKVTGYVVADPNDGSITVAFRGVPDINTWLQQKTVQGKEKETSSKFNGESALCKAGQQSASAGACEKFRAHHGILTAYLGIQGQVQQAVGGFLKQFKGPIFVTGHSLGGALAMLCGFDLRRQYQGRMAAVYTYGQPRAADTRFGSMLKKSGLPYFRVVNRKDPIVHWPRWSGWFSSSKVRHHGMEVWYRGGSGIVGSKSKDNHPQLCLWAPKRCSATLSENKGSFTWTKASANLADHYTENYLDGNQCQMQRNKKKQPTPNPGDYDADDEGTQPFAFEPEDKDVAEVGESVVYYNETADVGDFKWVPKYVWIMKGTPEWEAMESSRAAEGSFFRSTAGQTVIGMSAAALTSVLLVGVAAVFLLIRRKKERKQVCNIIA